MLGLVGEPPTSQFLKRVKICRQLALVPPNSRDAPGLLLFGASMARKARRKKSTKAQIAARRKKEAASLRQDGIPRAVLGRETQRQIERFNLSRDEAAVIVKDAASQMSRLMTGHLAEFSADRLAKMLTRLGSSITITIRHARKIGKRGRVVVKVER